MVIFREEILVDLQSLAIDGFSVCGIGNFNDGTCGKVGVISVIIALRADQFKFDFSFSTSCKLTYYATRFEWSKIDQ